MKKHIKSTVAYLMAAVMMFALLPEVRADAETGTKVRVRVEDYVAKNAGVEGASQTGVILDETVEAESVEGAVRGAFEKAGVEYDMSKGYVSSINDLEFTEGYPMSGWMLSNNDDCDNWGMDYIELKDGLELTFMYTLDGGADIAAAFNGLPTLKTLEAAGVKYEFETIVDYDESYKASYTYKVNGVELDGKGTPDEPFLLKPEIENVTDAGIAYSYTTMADVNYVDVTVSSDKFLADGKNEIVVTSRAGRKACYSVEITDKNAQTVTPTKEPTAAPTKEPTAAPTKEPTQTPTVTQIPATPSAALDSEDETTDIETFSHKGIKYTIKDGRTAVCNGFAGSSAKADVTIPASVKNKGVNYKVTGISSKAFANHKKLRSVVIGKNVKVIGSKAFAGCKKLRKITFKGKTVTSIAKNSFAGLSRSARIICSNSIYKKIKNSRHA